MSNLVIGGVSLAKLSELEIRFLLQKAESLGIIEIDTAPSYGSSQEKIGRVGLSKSWKINSKVLSPSSRDANRHTVRNSVENSLRELRIDQLNTVFVHSVRESEYKKEIHEELLLMKTEGKILNIGYSGDGRDLEEITSSFSFDALQAIVTGKQIGRAHV